MPAITLIGFRGEQPRITPRLLPQTHAQSAINARLDDGALTPFRLRAAEDDADPGQVTLFRQGATWHTWDAVVDAAPGPVATDRLYYTGDGVPKMRVSGTDYELALDPPAAALTATLDGSGSGDVFTRLYVYTWVTDFGEESAPAPVSNAVDWQNGYDVVLSGFASTPASRNITKQRIYRSQTGQLGTYFYLIAERNASSGNFTDDIAVDALQEPLPSQDWNPPPDDMAGLIAVHGGMMAAYSGKQLCISEPYRPHAWPEKYRLTMDYDIVGLAAAGNVIFVLTEGQPYLVTGSTPLAMLPQKLESNLACVGARSIVDLGYAVAYASHEGLVVLRADGSIGLVSGPLFDRDGWQRLGPETMIGCQYGGLYVAFYDNTENDVRRAGALFIDVASPQDLRRIDTIALGAFYDEADGGLYFIPDGGGIWRFDAPLADRATLYWKSKPFILPGSDNFGAIRIDAAADLTGEEEAALAAAQAAALAANAATIAAGLVGGELNGAEINALPINGDNLLPIPTGALAVTVGIICDGIRRQDITVTNMPKRLKSGFRGETWEIDVSANVKVTRIAIAKTMDELKNLP